MIQLLGGETLIPSLEELAADSSVERPKTCPIPLVLHKGTRAEDSLRETVWHTAGKERNSGLDIDFFPFFHERLAKIKKIEQSLFS
jgi:hypothetical protein